MKVTIQEGERNIQIELSPLEQRIPEQNGKDREKTEKQAAKQAAEREADLAAENRLEYINYCRAVFSLRQKQLGKFAEPVEKAGLGGKRAEDMEESPEESPEEIPR